MWRCAKIGAVSLGGLGLVGGISVCIAFHLPFPPIFVTEIGLLLGGLLGAMAGYARCFHCGRMALRGLAWGLLLALVLVVWAPWPALAAPLLGTLLGYQWGRAPQTQDRSPWSLRTPGPAPRRRW